MLTSIKAFIARYLVAGLLALVGVLGLSSVVLYKKFDTERQNVAQASAAIDQYKALTAAQKAAQEAADALHKETIKALTNRAVYAEKLVTQFKEQNRDLQNALDRNRDWADSPVPDSVLDALKRPHNR